MFQFQWHLSDPFTCCFTLIYPLRSIISWGDTLLRMLTRFQTPKKAPCRAAKAKSNLSGRIRAAIIEKKIAYYSKYFPHCVKNVFKTRLHQNRTHYKCTPKCILLQPFINNLGNFWWRAGNLFWGYYKRPLRNVVATLDLQCIWNPKK